MWMSEGALVFAYVASKWAVRGMTKTAAMDERGFEQTVIASASDAG